MGVCNITKAFFQGVCNHYCVKGSLQRDTSSKARLTKAHVSLAHLSSCRETMEKEPIQIHSSWRAIQKKREKHTCTI